MSKKMTKPQKKVKKVMKEFKKGKLNIGKSDKKVKSRKQAIAIALSRAGIDKKGANMAEENKKNLNHEMFTNKDGYVEGGKEVEMTNPSETQEQEVQGQGNILARKKEKLSGINMAWFSLAKIALQAGSKIYANQTEDEDGYV